MEEKNYLPRTQEVIGQVLTECQGILRQSLKKLMIRLLFLLMFLQFSFSNDISAQQSSDSIVSIVRYHYCIIKESRHGHKIFFGANNFYHKQIDTGSIRWENIVTVLNKMNELGWELTNVKGRSKKSWVLRKRIGIN